MLQKVSYVLGLRNASDSNPMLLHAQRHHAMSARRRHHAHALHNVRHLHIRPTTLFLGGEVDLILWCISWGFGTAAVASAYRYISQCLPQRSDPTEASQQPVAGKSATYLHRAGRNCT